MEASSGKTELSFTEARAKLGSSWNFLSDPCCDYLLSCELAEEGRANEACWVTEYQMIRPESSFSGKS